MSYTREMTDEKRILRLENMIESFSNQLKLFQEHVFNELELLHAQEKNTDMMDSVKSLVKIIEELQAENRRLKNGN